MKRERYQLLQQIADDICGMLEKAGVKHDEGCIVRRLADSQWEYTHRIEGSVLDQERLNYPTPEMCVEGGIR